MKNLFFLFILALSKPLPLLANADQLRFAPEPLNLSLAPASLLTEKTMSGFSLGGVQFPTDSTTSKYSEDKKSIVMTLDEKLIQPDFFLMFDQLRPEPIFSGKPSSAEDLKILKRENGLTTFSVTTSKVSLENLKFCFTEKKEDHSKVLCHEAQSSGSSLLVGTQMASGNQRISLEGLEKLQVVHKQGHLSFLIETSIPKVELFEASLDDQDNLKLVAFGSPVFGAVTKISGERLPLFQHSIGDTRKFYEVRIPKEAPFLNASGGKGIVFSFEIRGQQFPRDRTRVKLKEPTIRTTYGKTVDLELDLKPSMKAESQEQSVTGNLWTFASPELYKVNRASVKITDEIEGGAVSNVFDYEVYRGPQTYLSGRVGISFATGGNLSLVSDLIATHWFNEPFGRSYYFSRQRWGLNVGYLQTAVSSKKDSEYTNLHTDLLYRFSPGVTGWTETFGWAVSTMEFKYQSLDPVNFVGAGLFWSRSLPNWFNYLFGFFPFLRKPKWADIQVIHYPQALTGGISGSSTQVRATGRIDISPKYYFEGGWGIGNTVYTDTKRLQRVSLLAGRGFFGFGARF
ncbi:MAG: hypothetical protein LW875_04410 [Proteobacteria bacterium]|nr:hypothetical protein [Pseudomonadota bacterium]